MKKWIAALFLLLSAQVQAHILLTTPVPNATAPATATATAPHATVISNSLTYSTTGNVACVIYGFGTATFVSTTDTGFTQLANTPTVNLCLNLSNGVWSAVQSNGGPTMAGGTLTGASLTNANTVYSGPSAALRDAADLWASQTFLPGTQPATW